jgi:DNA-binding response OmpR family regulator
MARVLIVEDEPIIAFDLADQLAEAGFKVVGPALRASEGVALVAGEGCDVAILDVNLGQETSEVVALALAALGLPFVVVSGYSSDQHPAVFKGAPLVVKPVHFAQLLVELRRLTGRPAG